MSSFNAFVELFLNFRGGGELGRVKSKVAILNNKLKRTSKQAQAVGKKLGKLDNTDGPTKAKEQVKDLNNTLKKGVGYANAYNTALRNFGGSKKELRKLNDQLDSTISKLKGLSLTIAIPAFYITRSFIAQSSELEEQSQKFAVIFDQVLDKAEDRISAFRDEFETSMADSKTLFGQVGSLLAGLGFSDEDNLELSESIAKLALDLQSFNNDPRRPVNIAGLIVSFLTGQTMAGRSLGIIANEELVKLTLLKEKMEGLTFASKEQAKVSALMRIAIVQSVDAIGDAYRTRHSYINSLRRMIQQWNDLAAKMGDVLTGPLAKLFTNIKNLLKILNTIPNSVISIIVHLGSFITILIPLKLAILLARKYFLKYIGTLGLTKTQIAEVVTGQKVLGLSSEGLGKKISVLTSRFRALVFQGKKGTFSFKALAIQLKTLIGAKMLKGLSILKVSISGIALSVRMAVASLGPLLLTFLAIETAVTLVSKAIDIFKGKLPEDEIQVKGDTFGRHLEKFGKFQIKEGSVVRDRRLLESQINKVNNTTQNNRFGDTQIVVNQTITGNEEAEELSKMVVGGIEDKFNAEIQKASRLLGSTL